MTSSGHLLDSSVLIDYERGVPALIAFVNDLTRQEVPACSALTVYEVEVGVRPEHAHAARELLDALNVLPLTSSIASRAAAETRLARRRGRALSPVDAMIAATALLHNLTLVTCDRTGFHVPGLRAIVL